MKATPLVRHFIHIIAENLNSFKEIESRKGKGFRSELEFEARSF